MIWEKISLFNVTIEIIPIPIVPPMENDKWFMQGIEEVGAFDENEMVIINRFRCHQQVLFVSCIMDAGGRAVDGKYLKAREEFNDMVKTNIPQRTPTN